MLTKNDYLVTNNISPQQKNTSLPEQKNKMNFEYLMGNYRCNRYTASHPTTFASCKLENVCLTTSGKLLLFLPRDRMYVRDDFLQNLNTKPWVYTQGRVESDRGNQYVSLIDGDLMFEYNNSIIKNVFSVDLPHNLERGMDTIFKHMSEKGKKYDIDFNFSYIRKPVYGLKRYASGNMGHFIFENIMMPFANMMNHETTGSTQDIKTILDNHILFLDDLYDDSPDNWISIYQYDKKVATNFSMEISKLISNNTALQLCKGDEQLYSIEPLPCKKTNHVKKATQGEVLQTCFSSLIIGLTKNSFYEKDGRENILVNYRQFSYHSLNISPLPSEEDNETAMVHYLVEKPIRIAIHNKSIHTHYGRLIWNMQELSDHIQETLQNDKFFKNYHSNNKIIVDVFEFKSMSPLSQVRFFSDVDIFISDQGSSAYYGVYMRKDTSLIIAPECTTSGCATPLGFQKLSGLMNTQVIDYLELAVGPVMCNPRPSIAIKDNCDAILSPPIISKAVVALLKRRYNILIKAKLNSRGK